MNGMRMTGATVHRRYLQNLNTNFRRKTENEQRIATGRKFARASQNPMDAAKALKNRKAISETETYIANLEVAKGIYNSAEDALLGVSAIMQTLQEKLIAGATGTYNQQDKIIIAREIDSLADQMVRLMNAVFVDRRLFGGVNNATPAFAIHNGTVFYNGIDVNTVANPKDFPFSATSYLDAGLGMQFMPDGYTIDPQSAIAVTFNGAQALGCGKVIRDASTLNVTSYSGFGENAGFGPPVAGVSQRIFNGANQVTVNGVTKDIIVTKTVADGVTSYTVNDPNLAVINAGDGTYSIIARSNNTTFSMPPAAGGTLNTYSYLTPEGVFPKNIIQLTLDAAAAVRADNGCLTALYADIIFEEMSSLLIAITDLGTEQAFIDFNIERLTNNMFSLKTRENELEWADMHREMTTMKILEMIYNATLQMSATITPMSIFNFIK